jgi:hypothetical protein
MMNWHRISLSALFCGLALSGTPLAAQPAISIERIRADVKYLSSDQLQGRGVGSRGEDVAVDFIAQQFEKAGLKPAGEKGTHYQAVPLVMVTTGPTATLAMVKGTDTTSFKLLDEFAGVSKTQQSEDFDAEAIFCGHGITAPEFGWDDYKDVDVKGKVVVVFTNEPPSDDPKFFAGKALTYYGRWTYKYEEAARRGAKAVLIIHTNETAGYPYSVVKKLKGAQIQRTESSHELAFAGWLSTGAGNKLLASVGLTVEEALKKADTRGFKAIPLGVRFKGHIPTTTQKIASRNVLGLVEGSDPALKDEAILFTAHWDHLGLGKSSVGEEIFNGALDNATGCAVLLEMARVWAKQQPRPKRSALFLATTAEESGLETHDPARQDGAESQLRHGAAPRRAGVSRHQRRRAHHGLACHSKNRRPTQAGDRAGQERASGLLLPLRSLRHGARRRPGVFRLSRREDPRQARGLRPESDGVVHRQGVPHAGRRVPGELGLFRLSRPHALCVRRGS